MEKVLSSEFSIRSACEDVDSDADETPDPPPTAADVRKALHILRRTLENTGAEQDL